MGLVTGNKWLDICGRITTLIQEFREGILPARRSQRDICYGNVRHTPVLYQNG